MSRDNYIHVGESIELDTGIHWVESRQGSAVKVRNEQTGVTEVIALFALPERMVVMTKQLVIEPADLDLLMKWQLAVVRDRESHIHEVLTGEAPAGRSNDPKYAIHRNQEDRVSAKVAVLQEAGWKVSRATFYRWMSNYRRLGLAGLIDERWIRERSALENAPWQIVEVLRKVSRRETGQTTGTYLRLRDRVEHELREKFPGLVVEIPEDGTLRNWQRAIDKGNIVFDDAHNRRTRDKVAERTFQPRIAVAPGSEVHIDTTPFDIMAFDFQGNPVRLRLTVMLDKCTRSYLGSSAVLTAAKGVDHAILLARVMGRQHVRRRLNPEDLDLGPWTEGLTPEKIRRLQDIFPFIVPDRIFCDNGPDYAGQVFKSACRELGVSLTFAAPGTPPDNGISERFWESVETGWAQYLPGYLGRNTQERGTDWRNEPLLRIDELIEAFDLWAMVVYQSRPHGGLRNPSRPGEQHSPNSMYWAMMPACEAIPMAFTREEYIRLMPRKTRSIHPKGIECNGRWYVADELVAMRNMSSGVKADKGQFGVRWDPYDFSTIWLEKPHSDEFITCTAVGEHEEMMPLMPAFRRESARIQREIGAPSKHLQGRLVRQTLAHTQQNMKDAARDESRRHFNLQQRASSGVPDLSDVDTQQPSQGAKRPPSTRGRLLGNFDPEED